MGCWGTGSAAGAGGLCAGVGTLAMGNLLCAEAAAWLNSCGILAIARLPRCFLTCFHQQCFTLAVSQRFVVFEVGCYTTDGDTGSEGDGSGSLVESAALVEPEGEELDVAGLSAEEGAEGAEVSFGGV